MTGLIVRFSVPGQPVPRWWQYKPNPRRYQRYRARVLQNAQHHMKGRPESGPVAVEIVYRSSHHDDDPSAPDLDNIAKGILDGMCKIVFDDDAQVQDLRIRREATPGKPDQVVVTVRKHKEQSGGISS